MDRDQMDYNYHEGFMLNLPWETVPTTSELGQSYLVMPVDEVFFDKSHIVSNRCSKAFVTHFNWHKKTHSNTAHEFVVVRLEERPDDVGGERVAGRPRCSFISIDRRPKGQKLWKAGKNGDGGESVGEEEDKKPKESGRSACCFIHVIFCLM
jgi:hypothetical protein